MKKKLLILLIPFAACIIGYFISKEQIKKSFVGKEITYTNSNASEVEMAWGVVGEKLPESSLWPQNTVMIKDMLYTKLFVRDSIFSTTISLPAESIIYYWMVLKKDRAGNPIEVWDSGGNSKTNFSEAFSYNGIFKPGYFIFLSGCLPLFLLFFLNKKSKRNVHTDFKFNIKEYIPQFDSIRAIAVLLVIIHHWFPENKVLNFLPNGPLGVNTFFVLSGFLITGILLKSRKLVESGSKGKSTVFKNFYIRRSLRIFPIYYLLLLILSLLSNEEILQNGIYSVSYTHLTLPTTERV